MTEVFLLWHSYELNKDEDEDKLVGVYRSLDNAEAARERTALLAGFCDHPTDFFIDRMEIDKDHWTEGFATVQNGEFE